MTSKVTLKVTSCKAHFRYFWLDSKGREASGGLAKEGNSKAKGVQLKEMIQFCMLTKFIRIHSLPFSIWRQNDVTAIWLEGFLPYDYESRLQYVPTAICRRQYGRRQFVEGKMTHSRCKVGIDISCAPCPGSTRGQWGGVGGGYPWAEVLKPTPP